MFWRGTVAVKLPAVKRLYEAATWHGLRPDNPAAGLRAPKDKTARAERIRYLPLDGLRRLLAAPKGNQSAARSPMLQAKVSQTPHQPYSCRAFSPAFDIPYPPWYAYSNTKQSGWRFRPSQHHHSTKACSPSGGWAFCFDPVQGTGRSPNIEPW